MKQEETCDSLLESNFERGPDVSFANKTDLSYYPTVR
jgi:hypothetical protein